MKKIRCFFLALTLMVALSMTAQAVAPAGYVTDDSGLLTSAQQSRLETTAQSISNAAGVGVYLLTTDDHSQLGSYDVFEAAVNWYLENDLGLGKERSGVLLLLSMDTREYALMLYGDAQSRISTQGEIWLEEEFLDDFRTDDWAAGLEDYLQGTQRLLDGEKPWNAPKEAGAVAVDVAITAVISFGVAWVVLFLVKKVTMESVAKQTGAESYMTPGGTKIHRREDQFLHRRVRTRRIQTSSGSSGSHSRSSGGARGRSGRF